MTTFGTEFPLINKIIRAYGLGLENTCQQTKPTPLGTIPTTTMLPWSHWLHSNRPYKVDIQAVWEQHSRYKAQLPKRERRKGSSISV